MIIRQDTSKLSDRVVVDIQQRILSSELLVGSRLPTEAELCELFQVSRTVIRDALRTLTAMGLITVEQGRGINVTHPDDRTVGAAIAILLLRSGLTIGEILDARSVVETELCALAGRYANDEDIQRLEQRLEAFRAAVSAGNTEQAFEEHLAFHAALYDAIRIPAIALLLRPMVEVILLSSFPPQRDDPGLWEIEAHVRVLDAVRARDEVRIKAALREHFREMEGPAYAQLRKMYLRDSPAVPHLMRRINRMFGHLGEREQVAKRDASAMSVHAAEILDRRKRIVQRDVGP